MNGLCELGFFRLPNSTFWFPSLTQRCMRYRESAKLIVVRCCKHETLNSKPRVIVATLSVATAGPVSG